MIRRWGRAACAAVALAACGGDGPEPGALNIELSGPGPARAILVRAVGPGAATITAGAVTGSGVRVVAAHVGGDTLRLAVIAPAGQTLTGSVALLQVPDLRAAASWTAVVQQVAGPTYALQNPSLYTVAVVRP